MAWTPWRKLADRACWYPEHGLRFPVCYELGVAEWGNQAEPRVVYAGAALSEARLLFDLAEGREAISERAAGVLTGSTELYYRSTAAPTLEGAKELLAERLAGGVHPWVR